MHKFAELADSSTHVILNALRETEERAVEELQISAATPLVKSLQVVELGRAITAVGMFSLFDSILQAELGCADGFDEARKCLEKACEQQLLLRFEKFLLAINVLKHGRGRSYDALVNQIDALPFRIKRPDDRFFFEGDVSEISTLIEVDDRFVLGCVEVIRDVSNVISLGQPDVAR